MLPKSFLESKCPCFGKGESSKNISFSLRTNAERLNRLASEFNSPSQNKDLTSSTLLKKSSLESGHKIVVRFPYKNNSNNNNSIAGDKKADDKESSKRDWTLRPPCKKFKNTSDDSRVDQPKLVNNNRINISHQLINPEDTITKKMPSFCISLTKEEIEHDILTLTGDEKLARRPRRKRPFKEQGILDTMFPSLGLSSITPNSYKVRQRLH